MYFNKDFFSDPNSKPQFMFVHGIENTKHSVENGFRDVASFLANSTDVVVLDSHTFAKKWTNETHQLYQVGKKGEKLCLQ